MSTLKKRYNEKIKSELKESFKIKNIMEVPRLEKIVINRGLGEAVSNTKVIESTVEILKNITGQKPILTKAKKSISNFKIREGNIIGCKVTLRSDKMYDFLTKLLNITLPRIRDFRGLPTKSFDGRGNYTLGIKEDTIFPEALEEFDKSRGFDITFVTSTSDNRKAYELLKHFGMPFRNEMK